MATQFVLTDDIDGSTGDIETVRFSLDGANYEIDLSPANRQKLVDDLAPYASKARRADRRPVAPPRRAPRPANQTTPVIRKWAKDNGYAVPDRGRLPRPVVEAWEAAHAPHEN